MPIYEYTCLKCNAHTEVLQKMTDKALTRCRKCNGKLEKQWSQTSFQLKGTGWYVTDYAAKKSDGTDKTEKKGESASSESASSEPAKGETASKSDGAEKQKKATDSAKTDSTKSSDAAEKKPTEKSKKPTTTPSSSGD